MNIDDCLCIIKSKKEFDKRSGNEEYPGLIFEILDVLQHLSDPNVLTNLLLDMNYEFDNLKLLFIRMEHNSIDLTNSIFRAIAHEAVKFTKK